MNEKEQLTAILDILQDYCKTGCCKYCSFKDDSGKCTFKVLAETSPCAMSELYDYLERIE